MRKFYRKIKSFFSDESRKLKKNDFIIMGVMVLLYGILSFYNLGTTKSPQTFLTFDLAGNEATLEVDGDAVEISKIRHFSGVEEGSYLLLGSVDGEVYTDISTIDEEYSFSWYDDNLDNVKLKYLKIVSQEDGKSIGEIQLYDKYGDKVKLKSEYERSRLLIDEEDCVPVFIDNTNSMYFDEIYFAKSAYQYVNNLQVMEWVHPPLGKLIQMLPILIMGMSPFAYRLMGNIAGILMIPVLYIFAKTMFKNRKYATLAGCLMMFDTFHFAQTRMGTVDSFLVLFMMLSGLFMYKYLLLDKYDSIKPKIKYLFFSGLFFGLATCVKWTGLYLGLGLAIMFFAKLIIDTVKDKKLSKQYKKIMPWCVLVFVLIPVVIYLISYFAFPNVYPREVNSISSLIDQIKDMFLYHSTLDDTHPFSSKWYTWPIMLKPVWYYTSSIGTNLRSTIVGIGNPAIWWVGILGALYTLVSAIKSKKLENVFLIVMMLSLFIPYAFIDRCMFLYHYFPVIPFMMLAIVALLKFIHEKTKNIWVIGIYVAIVIMLFGWFYPVVSGSYMPEGYIESLKWLSTWYF